MNDPEHAKLADTYALVYDFLIRREHAKAAKYVKKAAKESGILSIKNKEEPSTLTGLEDIIFDWRNLSTRNVELETLNKQLSEEVRTLKKSQKRKKNSSDDDGSSSPNKSPKSSSSSSSSSSDSDTSKLRSNRKVHGPEAELNGKPKKQELQSIASNSEEELEVAKTVLTPATPVIDSPRAIPTYQKDEGSTFLDSKEGKTKPAQASDIVKHKSLKRRRTEDGEITTAVAVQVKNNPQRQTEVIKGGGKESRRGGTPFRRIRVEKLEFHDSRLMDNTFAARGAGETDYGSRASQDLIVTRGTGFRKEKNKKKRGSYRGGEITMESHSVKFE